MRTLRFTGDKLELLLNGIAQKEWPAEVSVRSAEHTPNDAPAESVQSGEYRMNKSAERRLLVFEWITDPSMKPTALGFLEIVAFKEGEPSSGKHQIRTTTDAIDEVLLHAETGMMLRVVYFQERFMKSTIRRF